MNNVTLSTLETLHSILSDIIDNDEVDNEVCCKCWAFDKEIKELIKKAKCQHSNTVSVTQKMHTETYKIETCTDCNKNVSMSAV